MPAAAAAMRMPKPLINPQAVNAMKKAGEATGEFEEETAKKLTIRVVNLAQQMTTDDIPTTSPFSFSTS